MDLGSQDDLLQYFVCVSLRRDKNLDKNKNKNDASVGDNSPQRILKRTRGGESAARVSRATPRAHFPLHGQASQPRLAHSAHFSKRSVNRLVRGTCANSERQKGGRFLMTIIYLFIYYDYQ
jgi:hypothetical protein